MRSLPARLILLTLLPATTWSQSGLRDTTEVFLQLYLLDLSRIDDTQEAITAEFVIEIRWPMAGVRDTIMPYATERMPRVEFRDLIDLQPVYPNEVVVDGAGMAVYNQRLLGTIQQRFDFTDFPYDEQMLKIEVFTRGSPPYRLVPDTTAVLGLMPGFEDLTAWDIQFEGLHRTRLPGPGSTLEALTYTFLLERHSVYYFWKILLPISLIVLMSWGAFWVPAEEISAQLTVSVTAILTLIAFQFSVSQLVPPLSYLTYLDKFSAGANFFVFLAFLESILTSYQAKVGRHRLSQRIDAFARFFFPIAFIIFLLVI
ncbi:hypothetical protein [Neolewinella sp.]|uniref:hypothetical protein n=1 Tax=Neolewinella sp. TaxID=2993543 RepID=UPI003B51F25C